ncbi:MAG: ComEA family DNA-binding protein [Candidatus Latescibacterota bacterium]
MMRKKIDLNTATREELMTVDGVLPDTADAIVRYREENGYIQSVEELRDIPGIRPITLDIMYDVFSVSGGVPVAGDAEVHGASAHPRGAFGSKDNPGAWRDADSNKSTDTGGFPDTKHARTTSKKTVGGG